MALDFLVNLIFIEVKEIVIHDDADTGEELGVYAIFIEEVVDVGAMATEFTGQPDDALAVLLQLVAEFVAYVHGCWFVVCV